MIGTFLFETKCLYVCGSDVFEISRGFLLNIESLKQFIQLVLVLRRMSNV